MPDTPPRYHLGLGTYPAGAALSNTWRPLDYCQSRLVYDELEWTGRAVRLACSVSSLVTARAELLGQGYHVIGRPFSISAVDPAPADLWVAVLYTSAPCVLGPWPRQKGGPAPRVGLPTPRVFYGTAAEDRPLPLDRLRQVGFEEARELGAGVFELAAIGGFL